MRVNLAQAHPLCFEALGTLNSIIDAVATAAGLSVKTLELMKVHASQINGCASCIRLHTLEAIKMGETPERLALVSAWRECQYFTPVEQATFLIAESITRIGDGPMTDMTYASVTDVLTAEQISVVAWAAISINAWNRVALTSRWPVAPPSEQP